MYVQTKNLKMFYLLSLIIQIKILLFAHCSRGGVAKGKVGHPPVQQTQQQAHEDVAPVCV